MEKGLHAKNFILPYLTSYGSGANVNGAYLTDSGDIYYFVNPISNTKLTSVLYKLSFSQLNLPQIVYQCSNCTGGTQKTDYPYVFYDTAKLSSSGYVEPQKLYSYNLLTNKSTYLDTY